MGWVSSDFDKKICLVNCNYWFFMALLSIVIECSETVEYCSPVIVYKT
jgi:hypothetical protein